jgi:hypothetical protein
VFSCHRAPPGRDVLAKATIAHTLFAAFKPRAAQDTTVHRIGVQGALKSGNADQIHQLVCTLAYIYLLYRKIVV